MTTTDQITKLIDANTELKHYFEGARDNIDQRLERCEEKVDDAIARWGVASCTLEVGSGKRFGSIQAAWDYLQGKKISGGVLIQVADGVYKVNKIELNNHPDAHWVRIHGNLDNPAACTIQFTPDSKGYSHGILMRDVRRLELGGFKLLGVHGQTKHMLHLNEHANVYCRTGTIIMEGCKYGIEAYTHSKIVASGLKITNCSDGIVAASGAEVHAHDLEARGQKRGSGIGVYVREHARAYAARARCQDFDLGFHARSNSFIYCDDARVENCDEGFYSHTQATIWTHNSTAVSCGMGFTARNNGTIFGKEQRAEGCKYGFYANQNSHLYAPSSHAVNCSEYGYGAHWGSMMDAGGTKAKCLGNKLNYTPGTSGAIGNGGAVIYIT